MKGASLRLEAPILLLETAKFLLGYLGVLPGGPPQPSESDRLEDVPFEWRRRRLDGWRAVVLAVEDALHGVADDHSRQITPLVTAEGLLDTTDGLLPVAPLFHVRQRRRERFRLSDELPHGRGIYHPTLVDTPLDWGGQRADLKHRFKGRGDLTRCLRFGAYPSETIRAANTLTEKGFFESDLLDSGVPDGVGPEGSGGLEGRGSKQATAFVVVPSRGIIPVWMGYV